MTYFAAIDFETANGRRSSVCSVGIVIVRPIWTISIIHFSTDLSEHRRG